MDSTLSINLDISNHRTIYCSKYVLDVEQLDARYLNWMYSWIKKKDLYKKRYRFASKT